MYLTDTHCHLNFDTFIEDFDNVLENAINAGVKKILVPGIDIPSSQKAIYLSDKHESIYAAVGIHPNSAIRWNAEIEKEIYNLASHPKVVAIGEIGMDSYRKNTSLTQQKITLEAQLAIAETRELPIVIHNREASEILFPILIDWQKRLISNMNKLHLNPGVLHAFNNPGDFLHNLIEANFQFGFGGPITYKNNHRIWDLVKQLPLNRLLIETDAPFLTPHPKRGKRNEPAYTAYIAQRLSELKERHISKILDITYKNANRLFCWSNSERA